jgi:hypothetical protein
LLLVKAIVNGSLPLYLVDQPDFKVFINTLNPQYRLSSKKRLTTTLIPNVHSKCAELVKEEIQNVDSTTCSSDAWTDPRTKAFYANSADIIDSQWVPKTFLLGCTRMKGRHTHDNIFCKYQELTNKFKVNGKITHNMTDAAANMKKAWGKTSFMNKRVVDGILQEYNSQMQKSFTLANIEEEKEEEDDMVENESEASSIDGSEEIQNSQATSYFSDSESTDATLKDLSNGDDEIDIFSRIFEDDEDDSPERLNCVIHQLQLVIKDSKEGCKNIENCVERVASFIAKGSSSYLIKDRIELAEGFLGKRNATRWNSEHNMCSSFLKFSDDDLNEIYGQEKVLTQVQRSTLNEFVNILEPFLEATVFLQKAAFSIGHVLPSIRGNLLFINKHCYSLFH